jgi:predicted amidohydrolase YtcJ
VLIRDAEIEGTGPIDVRLEGARVAEIGAGIRRRTSEAVFDARGGALLPGLHDHHIHLHALAAALVSIPCGPPAVGNEAALVRALRSAARAGRGWMRGVAYHESVAGPLDRDRLDAWVADRPLRIQHRSGSAWLVNSAALAALGIEGAEAPAGPLPDGLERAADGRATGRLFRADAWLRERIGGSGPDLAAVGARLASFGVTGLTDATAHNDANTLQRFCEASESGTLPQRILVMGEPALPAPRTARVTRGAVKILLDEPRLPGFESLVSRIRAAHREARGVAIHCVTRAELVFAVEAFREAGATAGDRLEHAAVAPPELVRLVAGLPLTVVTQPHFLRERGDAYRNDVAAEDLPWLYRARAWRDAGVPLGAGSDAPFGSHDPWRSMAAAIDRRTPDGVVLGSDEALPPEEALALYTTPAASPGGVARRVAVGTDADLCLLDRPWRDARSRLRSDAVAATWCAGRLVWTHSG